MASAATLAGAPAAAKPEAPQASGIIVPFVRAAQEHIEAFYDSSTLLGANATQLQPIDIPAYGFMRGIWLEVTTTGGTGAAAVYKGDAPFTALTDVSVIDVNSAPIFGPFDGWDVATVVGKYGGLRKFPQSIKALPDYAAPTTGNFSFMLYVPIECNPRDGLGALPNANAASSYKLKMSIAPKANVFSTDPTTLPTVRVRAFLDAWTQPDDMSLRGEPQAVEPPAVGTTSYWSKQTFNVNSGFQTFRLQRVGNYIRNLAFVFRDATGVRNKTNFPGQFDINWDTRLLKSYAPNVWRAQMSQRFGLVGADEASNGLDTGVYVEDYCHEFDGFPGLELRDGWLPTGQSTRLDVVGTFGAAGTLTVYTNDVSPAGEVFV